MPISDRIEAFRTTHTRIVIWFGSSTLSRIWVTRQVLLYDVLLFSYAQQSKLHRETLKFFFTITLLHTVVFFYSGSDHYAMTDFRPSPNPDRLTVQDILALIRFCLVCGRPWPRGKLRCASEECGVKLRVEPNAFNWWLFYPRCNA